MNNSEASTLNLSSFSFLYFPPFIPTFAQGLIPIKQPWLHTDNHRTIQLMTVHKSLANILFLFLQGLAFKCKHLWTLHFSCLSFCHMIKAQMPLELLLFCWFQGILLMRFIKMYLQIKLPKDCLHTKCYQENDCDKKTITKNRFRIKPDCQLFFHGVIFLPPEIIHQRLLP